jgi:hypothetical protein
MSKNEFFVYYWIDVGDIKIFWFLLCLLSNLSKSLDFFFKNGLKPPFISLIDASFSYIFVYSKII